MEYLSEAVEIWNILDPKNNPNPVKSHTQTLDNCVMSLLCNVIDNRAVSFGLILLGDLATSASSEI